VKGLISNIRPLVRYNKEKIMPIYIDRHFIEGATKSAISDAHNKDLLIQDKYGVKFVTYWFDEERCTAFCLVDAPNKEAVVETHKEAHGDVPHEIIEVDPSIVQTFLGRVKDPTPVNNSDEVSFDSAFRAIMFTDLKDSTLMTTMFGDARALHLLHIHNALTRNAIRDFNGTEVKHMGDGFMASFTSVMDQINCAKSIQKSFYEYNQKNKDEPLYVRIGLSAGEPIEEHGDLFGSAVQLAARLCAFAEPCQILAAKIVHDQVKEDSLLSEFIEIKPKGFLEPVHAFTIKWMED